MTAPAYTYLLISNDGGAQIITLHNPARKNAIGPVMVNELLYAIAAAVDDQEVRAIVLTGSGDAFCAGGDFAQMTGSTGQTGEDRVIRGDYADLLLAMVNSPKPIIARVNGHATGGGFGLVCAADFAVAAETAKLGD